MVVPGSIPKINLLFNKAGVLLIIMEYKATNISGGSKIQLEVNNFKLKTIY